MKRRLPGLHETSLPAEVPDGLYLVRVGRAQYRWHRDKPFYAIRFTVLEPKTMAGSSFSSRLYCTQKALWKLSWFLRDFGYAAELLGQDELDESAVAKLHGVVKISNTVVNGTSLLNLDGFAPAAQWQELSVSGSKADSEVAS